MAHSDALLLWGHRGWRLARSSCEERTASYLYFSINSYYVQTYYGLQPYMVSTKDIRGLKIERIKNKDVIVVRVI